MTVTLRPASIRFRLLLASTTVQVVLLSLLLANSVRLMNNAATASLQTTISQHAGLLEVIARRHAEPEHHAKLDALLRATLANSDGGLTYVRILDHARQPLFSIGKIPEGAWQNSIALSEAAMPRPPLRNASLHLRQPLTLDGDEPGWLQFGIAATPLVEARSAIIRQGMSIALAEVVLTFVLLSLIGYFLTRRLGALLAGSKALADGHLEHRVPDQGRDELALIARHFNVMARTLQQRMSGLRITAERNSLALQGSNDGLWDWDIVANRVFYSDRFYEILALPVGSLPSTPRDFNAYIHPAERPHYRERMIEHLQGRSPQFSMEHRVRIAEGDYRWVLTRGQVQRLASGQLVRMAGSITDIDARKRTEEQLRIDALHDALTGLPNRSLFVEMANHALKRQRMHQQHRLAILVLRMKTGQQAADDEDSTAAQNRQLCALASHLRTRLSANTLIARVGEQEFALLLESLPPGSSDAMRLAESLVLGPELGFASLSTERLPRQHIGIAFSGNDCTDSEGLLRQAEAALHRSYLQDTSAIAFFEESVHADALDRLPPEANSSLPPIVDGELEVHYQPLIALDSGDMMAIEAVVRWPQEVASLISSATFLSITEALNLVHDLGLEVLRTACADVNSWRRQFDNASLPIVLKLSVAQLSRPNLETELLAILNRNGLASRQFYLEVSEQQLQDAVAACHAPLLALREAGFRLILGDFGSGGASSLLLSRLPWSLIRLDQEWTRELDDDPRLFAVLSRLCQLCGELGIDVAATAVDNEIQLASLRRAGCRLAQGTVFNPPPALAAASA